MTRQRIYDFQPGTKISSSQVDQEFDSIIDALNQIDARGDVLAQNIQANLNLVKSFGLGGNAGSVVDANTLGNVSGFYKGQNITNAPDNGNFYIIHVSFNDTTAWQMAMRSDGYDTFIRIKNSNAWQSWIATYRNTNKSLYSNASGLYMHSGQTITPSIPLDQTVNGWCLLWGDFDPGTSTAGNFDYVTTFIHKSQPKAKTLHPIPRYLSDTTEGVSVKALYHTNTTITGDGSNGTNPQSRDIVLRQVLAW